MKKEILIAILLGLSLGLFITYGLYRTRNAGSENQISNTENISSSPEIEVLSTLVLNSPEDESIVAESTLPVSGDTEPNNFIVIFINNEQYITTADSTGAFSVSAELEPGSNVILVYSLDEDGNQTVEERVVVYTTRPLVEEVPTETPNPEDSADGDTKTTEDTQEDEDV